MLTTRPLNVEDLMLVADIIDRLMDHVDPAEVQSLFGGMKGNDAQAVGFKVVQLAVKHARNDFFKLMASVNEMDVEAFRSKPATAIPSTLKSLMEDDRNRDFFSQLSALLPKRKA